MRPTWTTVAAFLAFCALTVAGTTALAEVPPDATISRVPNPPLSSDLANLPGDLGAIAAPAPSNLDDFVKDPVIARALGKALFWDMQVGSDGVQACASCHFRAGADPRSKNQVSPGLRHAPEADLTYSTGAGPNHQLEASDFPLTRLAIPGFRARSMRSLTATTPCPRRASITSAMVATPRAFPLARRTPAGSSRATPRR